MATAAKTKRQKGKKKASVMASFKRPTSLHATPAEAAEFLNVSKWAIYRAIKSEKLEHVQAFGQYRILWSVLLAMSPHAFDGIRQEAVAWRRRGRMPREYNPRTADKPPAMTKRANKLDRESIGKREHSFEPGAAFRSLPANHPTFSAWKVRTDMIKRSELADPNSCLNKAADDELLFVLIGRDEDMADTIRYWTRRRIRRGKIGRVISRSSRHCN